MLIVETIAGVLVLSTNARRTTVRNVITNYLNRPRVNVVPSSPALIDENTQKYGVGFGLLVRADFVARSDADAAWADVVSNVAILANGSFIDQYTSVEGGATDETDYVHRLNVPSQPTDF